MRLRLRLRLGRAQSGLRPRTAARALFLAASVFAGMGLGSWFGSEVVTGHGTPDKRLLPLGSPDVARLIPGSALPSIAVDAERAASLLDVELGFARAVTAPGADSRTTAAECLLASQAGTRAVYGQDWAAFSKTTMQTAEEDSSTQVVLAVGLYPSEAKASRAFDSLAEALRGCDGKSAVETDVQGAQSALDFHVEQAHAEQAQPEGLRWRSEQKDPAERRCSYDARARRNALLEVMVCVAGEGGKEAKAVADLLEDAVPS